MNELDTEGLLTFMKGRKLKLVFYEPRDLTTVKQRLCH